VNYDAPLLSNYLRKVKNSFKGKNTLNEKREAVRSGKIIAKRRGINYAGYPHPINLRSSGVVSEMDPISE
jgi:hypothetical protein